MVEGGSYDDETVRKLFAEADKYLGIPVCMGQFQPGDFFLTVLVL